jgi:hypothetical protein
MGTVREYLRRLWVELTILFSGTVIVFGLLTAIVKGGLFIPITSGVVIFLAGFVTANVRLVTRLMREKSAVEGQRTQLETDRSRLTDERDDARRQRDFAQAAMALLKGETRDVAVTVMLSPDLVPKPKRKRKARSKKLSAPKALPPPPPALPAHPEQLTPPPEQPIVGDP